MLAGLAGELHAHVHASLAKLVLTWRDSGRLAPDAEPGQAASTMDSLVHGFLLQRAVLRGVSAADYAGGVAGLLGGAARVRPRP